MAWYDRPTAMALQKITQYGRSIQIVLFSDVAGAQPWRPGTAETVYNTVGLFVATKEEKQWVGVGAGAVGEAGQQNPSEVADVIVPGGLALPPELKGEIRAGADRWTILSISRVAPSGVTILYRITVKR